MSNPVHPQIRLVVSDIDGTLTRNDKSLPEANVEAIKRLIGAGIAFTLISARPPLGMLWIAETLGLDGPLGAFNGGTIVMPDGRIVEKHCVRRTTAERAFDMIDRPEAILWVFADGIWHTQKTDDVHTPREVKSAGQQPVIVGDFTGLLDKIDKIVVVSDDAAFLDPLEMRVADAIGGHATVVRSQTYYLDITATAANKGEGIAKLARSIGVPLDATAAFGDQHNDLAMFKRAAFAVAMGQAPEAVRAAADAISRSNDDDGVAYAIDTFVLGGIAP